MLHCTAAAEAVKNLQEKIVNLLFLKFYPGEPCLFKAAKLLKMADIHKLYAAVQVFRIQRASPTNPLSELIEMVPTSHRYPTRRGKLFVQPRFRVDSLRICFRNQFIEIWNH